MSCPLPLPLALTGAARPRSGVAGAAGAACEGRDTAAWCRARRRLARCRRLAAFWAGVASDSVFALLALESLELPEEPFDVSRDGELDVELGEDETGEPSE
jgi:hypothetical protein